MSYVEAILAGSTGVFAVLSAVLFVLLRRRKLRPKLDIKAQDLLHDLTSRGSAVIRIDVIDAANLFLRSPRH